MMDQSRAVTERQLGRGLVRKRCDRRSGSETCSLDEYHEGPCSFEKAQIDRAGHRQSPGGPGMRRLPKGDSGDPDDPSSRAFARKLPHRRVHFVDTNDHLPAPKEGSLCLNLGMSMDLCSLHVDNDYQCDEVELSTHPPGVMIPKDSDVYHALLEPYEVDGIDVIAAFAKKSRFVKKVKVEQCMVEDVLRHITVPRNLKEAMEHELSEDFIEACHRELAEHKANGSWRPQLIPRTEKMNVVGSTWAFDITRDMNKRIICCKARLCGQGFSQVMKGVDYFSKYSHALCVS